MTQRAPGYNCRHGLSDPTVVIGTALARHRVQGRRCEDSQLIHGTDLASAHRVVYRLIAALAAEGNLNRTPGSSRTTRRSPQESRDVPQDDIVEFLLQQLS